MGVALVLCVAALSASAPGAQLQAEPPFAEAGATSQVVLTFRLPEGTGKPSAVDLQASIGEVGAVEVTAEGTFRAVWQPPPQRFPQLAFFHAVAEVDGSVHTAARVLPVHGRDRLELKTKPRSKVTVELAGRTFSGVADRKGDVAVTIYVPPGVDTATVDSVDRVGNRTRKPLPLHPPPYPRAFAALARASRAASWADDAPAWVEVIAATAKGAPLPEADGVGLGAARGRTEALAAHGPGRWRTRYHAPREVADGVDAFTVSLPGGEQAGGGKTTVLPGPPAQVQVVFEPQVFVAGEQEHVLVRVVVRDAADNEVPAPEGLQLTSDMGELVTTEDGEPRLLLPASFGGRTAARVDVVVGEVRHTGEVPLRPGPPVQGALVLSRRMARAGVAPAVGEVHLSDRFGNPVSGEKLEVRVPGSQAEATSEELGGGRYLVGYQPPSEHAPGESALEVRPRGSALALSQPLVVLPWRRDVGLHVGLWALGHHNLGAVRGASPSVEVGVRPGQLPLDVVVQGTLVRYARVSLPHAGAGDGVVRRVDLDRQQLAAGARLSLPLNARWSVQGAVLGGASRTRSTVSVEGLRDAPPPVEEGPRFAPLVSAGAGVSLRLGPGRLMLEGRGTWAPASGQVQGNLDGAAAAVGYLFEVL